MLATWADAIPDWVVYAILLMPVFLFVAAALGLFLMLRRGSDNTRSDQPSWIDLERRLKEDQQSIPTERTRGHT